MPFDRFDDIDGDAMNAMRVVCAACGCHLEVIPAAAPERVNCPECGKRIELRNHLPAEALTPAIQPELAADHPPRRPAKRRLTHVAPVLIACGFAAAIATVALVATRSGSDQTVRAPMATTAPKDGARGEELAGDGSAHRGDGIRALSEPTKTNSARDPSTVPFAPPVEPTRSVATSQPAVARTPQPTTVASAPPADNAIAATTKPTTAPVVLDPADAIRMAADTAPALRNPPPVPSLKAYTLPDGISDAEIGVAIDRAISWLRSNGGARQMAPQRGRGGPFGNGFRRRGPAINDDNPPGGNDGPGSIGGTLLPGGGQQPNGPRMVVGPELADTPVGYQLLATYALIQAGQATSKPGLGVRDPVVIAALEQIKQYDLRATYLRSLRAATLSVYNRVEDRSCLEQDVRWLVSAHRLGGYTYGMPIGSDRTYDNSNSQYGLLGVWSGAQSGISVGSNYWVSVAQHWIGCASPAGTWGYEYNGGPPYLSMTLAGVASLLVSHEYLDAAAEASGTARPPAHTPALDQGLNWLDQGDNAVSGLGMFGTGTYTSYTVYGLERVGLASGYKYFGQHDWYGEFARKLVNGQRGDGSWNESVVDTSYYLLFLSRGRHPILYNKLRYDGDWNNRPHDVAHLARFAAQQLERPLNWQVVNLRRNWFDWMDSPVLYISGDRAPNMTDHDYAALRDFAQGGGMIFTHADGGSAAFTVWVREMVRRTFPKYELMRVPKDHPLNTVVYRLKDPPDLEVVSNGSRILMVHCPTDVANGWQLNWSDEKRPDFQLGVNLFVYAAGKTDFNNRLASTYIPPWPDSPTVTRAVARLRFAGEWDPEPYAWTRFARYFTWDTHAGLDVQTIDLKSLLPGQVPAAFMTGTVRQDFTPTEAAAARAYVEAGGVLVIDACGGQEPFAMSVRDKFLPAAFPRAMLAALPSDHPALVASRPFADDLTKLPLRPFASEKLNTHTMAIEGFKFGRGWVIFSRLDLTTGLLGTQSWGILGYDPASAQALVKNVVLWATARDAKRTLPPLASPRL